MSALKENLFTSEQILFLFKQTPVEKGGKNKNCRVVSPERVSSYFMILSRLLRLFLQTQKFFFFQALA